LKKSNYFIEGNYEQALKETFTEIDEHLKTEEGRNELADISSSLTKTPGIMSRMEGEDLANGVGCTACVALLTKTDIYVANAGDSRCVLCKNKQTIPMSEDHKPDLPREKNRIYNAGGFIEDGRVKGILNLSRSLGDLEYKLNKAISPSEQMITCVPDTRVEKISSDTEFLIIACDGIWDCLTSEKAVSIFREKIVNPTTNKPQKAKLGKVISDVLDSIIATDLNNSDGIGSDNMTCMVIQFFHS
jgi:serine/threonine protein phosphatase PrpC